jgi:lipopolysaccharide export system protein LptA
MKHLALLVTIVMTFYAASPLPLLAHGARQDKPVDVAGKWALTVETAGGTGTPTIELAQDGQSLSGTYSSSVFGEQKLTGTIKGDAISFGFTGSFQGATVTVTYTGTADPTTMKGKVTVGDVGEGTFTGKKQ